MGNIAFAAVFFRT